MKYKNATEVLPGKLVQEIQNYIDGEILYIPKTESSKKKWGAVSGSKNFYIERNTNIRELFYSGVSVKELAKEFGLSNSAIKKIIYQKNI